LTTKRSIIGSKPSKIASGSSNGKHPPVSLPPDPLDRARERLDRADQATDLLEYSADFDEPTARTEVHVHHPQPSQPEIIRTEPPEKRLIGVLNVALGFQRWPQVIALGVLVAGALAAYWLKTR
jgi:hypothetical protein